MWVVCRHKDDNTLFITTRAARETMLNVILDLGQPVDSMVLRQFATYIEADNYKKEMERIDKDINKLLK